MSPTLQSATTLYDRPWLARALLTLLAVATLALLAAASNQTNRKFLAESRRGSRDLQLYRAEIERMRAGEPYYHAVAAELSNRGYPTQTVFNWRTPSVVWLLGQFSSYRAPLLLLQAGAILFVVGITVVIARDGSPLSWPLAAALCGGAVVPAWFGEVALLTELWAGVLLGLSLLAYGWCRPKSGAALGVGALAMRELAAPYCALGVWQAARERKVGELLVWLAGLAIYCALFAWHVMEVQNHMPSGGRAQDHFWVYGGGAPFLIGLAQMNVWLINAPAWVAALYLVAAMAGWATWNTPLGRRVGLAGAVYVTLLAIVGQPFNQYWGLTISPLLALGAAQAPAGLWLLVKTACGHATPALSAA